MSEDTENRIVLPTALGRKRDGELRAYAEAIQSMQDQMKHKVSARGWCYIMEPEGLIVKDQFDLVERANHECVNKGILPVDFFLEDTVRNFTGVEKPQNESPEEDLKQWLTTVLDAENLYIPDWWTYEEYYIQMVVEKIDIKVMFKSVCKEYHIPIANARGWSSKLQRATFARRFKEAEERGLKPVLLYLGDHDPDGIRISDFLRENLKQLEDVVWLDGETGYNPDDLIIDRFGLNFDYIEEHKLTWIDNLITSGGKDLSSPSHKNHMLQYVQDYLKLYGRRKCEANALLKIPDKAEDLCRSAIEKYLGTGAKARFHKVRQDIVAKFEKLNEKTGYKDAIEKVMKL